MKKAFLLALVGAAAMLARPAAQSAQTNINVLPVLTDADGHVITPSDDRTRLSRAITTCSARSNQPSRSRREI